MALIFEPVRTDEDIIKELIVLKNEQSILRIKENKLIDELVKLNKEDKDAELDNIQSNVLNIYDNMVLYSEMDILMDIGMIEANTIILKKTVKYLNGEMKVTVEKRIKDNYKLIDDFFDDLAEEYKSIESYENQQEVLWQPKQ